MNTELTECTNCNSKLKSGLLSNVSLLTYEKVNIINEYHNVKAKTYCNKCGSDLYNKYKTKLVDERNQLKLDLRRNISSIPVVSIHSPLNWNYEILSMITGQSTTGTGLLSEFTSTFTDIFGAQSGRLNRKFKEGEDFCFTQLRKQTLDLGGNAVIATDIDYSEVGGGKGILMVCMGGTAIKLKNLEILGEEIEENINRLYQFNNRIKELYNLYPDEF